MKPRRRSMRLGAIFTLCLCVSMGWGLDALAAAACTQPAFGPPAIYSSRSVRSLAIADFDVDGKLDLVALNYGDPGSLSLYVGDGTGALSLRSTIFQRGRRPNALAAGDFNGDGRPDLVIANGSNVEGIATVYLNNNLLFDQQVRLRWTSIGPDSNATSVAAADVNADGKLDVVLTKTDFNGVLVSLGDGAGNFSGFKSYGTGGFFPLHVVARDFNGDGQIDLAVANLNGESGGNVALLLGDGAGAFGTPTTYAAGPSPSSIAAGDFNSDNKLDLAVASGGGQNVSILLGDGAGGFAAPASVSTGGTAEGRALVAVDVNGDGKIDLAVANRQEGNVVVLLGDGAGSFNQSTAYNTGAANPFVIAASDLNGDALPELLVGHETSQKISVFLNTCGAGDNAATLNFNAPGYVVEETTSSVTVTVNRNGPLGGTATVNYATSDGGAFNSSDYKATTGTLSFAPGEASRTFTVEIVNDAVDEPIETFFVTLSNPTGAAVAANASAATIHIIDDDPTPALAVGDASVAEGDGGPASALFTVTLSGASSAQVQVNYTTSDLAATAGVDYVGASGTITFAPGETARTISIAVNGDTVAEVSESFLFTLSAPVNATIADAQGVGTILEDDAGCPAPSFAAAANVDIATPLGLVSGDFNRDGKTDVAAIDYASGSLKVRLGDGAGAFGAAASFPVGEAPRSLALGDFNLDGKTDIAVSRSAVSGPEGISILLGNGAGGFAPATSVGTGPLPYFVAIGDFNLDARPDLLVVSAGPGSGAVAVQLGDGLGGFGPPVSSFAVQTSPLHAVVADFNGDGKPDAAVANMNSNSISVLRGDGTGAFSSMSILPVGGNPRGLSAGDFNGDGKLDLVVANSGSDSISLLPANGAGGFGAAVNFAVGVRPNGLASGDLNGDGWLDVVTANYQLNDSTAGDVSILYGTGTGRFAQPSNFPVGRGPTGVISADFNGDARGDLIVANFSTNNLSVLLNACAATPAPKTFQFSAPAFEQNEGGGRAALHVTRTGDASGVASVDYRTTDTDNFTVSCSDTGNNNGSAYARCDFATVVGKLDFAAGESQKTIFVPVIDDGHDEGAETFQVVLSNPAGAALSATHAATVTINDNDAASATNPIFTTPFFVRQHYLDFLSREPEANEPWSSVLDRCPNVNNDISCDRLLVSQSFFGSPEFQLKGFYVFRFYKLAFNRLPEYTEIVSDMSFVAGATEAEVYARKAQLSRLFAERPEFHHAYGNLANDAFVATLLGRYQLTEISTPDPTRPDGAEKVRLTRENLIDGLGGGRSDARAGVARRGRLGRSERAGIR
jgi:hypothetical protein